jgi:hypothetical protein
MAKTKRGPKPRRPGRKVTLILRDPIALTQLEAAAYRSNDTWSRIVERLLVEHLPPAAADAVRTAEA